MTEATRLDAGSASRTAMAVAMRRAHHQLSDRPLVLDDPLALRMLGETLRARLDSRRAADNGRGRALRAFIVARSRLAEDVLASAFRGGVRQYVVLGAGLDTFAYRNPHAGLRVFEIDHPATQRWKHERLRAAGIAISPAVSFAPVDFSRETFAAPLVDAGFDPAAPAVFSWLGVTMYLPRPAVEQTLEEIAGAGADRTVVFDYAVTARRLGPTSLVARWLLKRRVARAGEPFRSEFAPDDLATTLRRVGFGAVDDLGAAELNAKYFADRSDRLAVRGGVGRIAVASTDPRATPR